MRVYLQALLFCVFLGGYGQQSQNVVYDSISGQQVQVNAYQKILSNLAGIPQGVTIGGYGEVLYNQPQSSNGELDVQRLVMLFGYKFDDRVQFVTEIEFEHVKEVFVEQAFVNYSIANSTNIRAGLLLVPMGIVNEFHEPTTFNGVERPSMDNAIVPTTWREIGMGVSGRMDALSLRYQAYIFNGFLSHNNSGGVLSGSNGLRNGRQKGAKSIVSQFNFSSKIDFYGIQNLRLGLAGYFGRTQSDDDFINTLGSTIGISMIGLDARYNYKRFSSRGQFVNAFLSDTEQYNTLTGKDLGKELLGYYIEVAYNLLPLVNKQRLDAFVRYEDYNTHANTAGNLTQNLAYHRKEWTLGFSYHLSRGSVFKIDYQNKATAISNSGKGQFNMGVGVWF